MWFLRPRGCSPPSVPTVRAWRRCVAGQQPYTLRSLVLPAAARFTLPTRRPPSLLHHPLAARTDAYSASLGHHGFSRLLSRPALHRIHGPSSHPDSTFPLSRLISSHSHTHGVSHPAISPIFSPTLPCFSHSRPFHFSTPFSLFFAVRCRPRPRLYTKGSLRPSINL